VCICIHRYPASNVHVPYCHLWPDPFYIIFPHYLINGTILKVLQNIKWVFWVSIQLLSVSFLVLRRNERDMIKNVYCYSYNVPVILVPYEWNLKLLDRFLKNTQTSNFKKIRPVGAGVSHVDRWTGEHTEKRSDMTKLIEAFRNFANAHKNSKQKLRLWISPSCTRENYVSVGSVRLPVSRWYSAWACCDHYHVESTNTGVVFDVWILEGYSFEVINTAMYCHLKSNIRNLP
jgi:hypothetical protein